METRKRGGGNVEVTHGASHCLVEDVVPSARSGVVSSLHSAIRTPRFALQQSSQHRAQWTPTTSFPDETSTMQVTPNASWKSRVGLATVFVVSLGRVGTSFWIRTRLMKTQKRQFKWKVCKKKKAVTVVPLDPCSTSGWTLLFIPIPPDIPVKCSPSSEVFSTGGFRMFGISYTQAVRPRVSPIVTAC